MKNIFYKNSCLAVFCFLIFPVFFCTMSCKAETTIEALHVDEQHFSEKKPNGHAPKPHIDPIQKDKALILTLSQQIKICKNQLDELTALKKWADARIKEPDHSQFTGKQSETYVNASDTLQMRTTQLNSEIQRLHSSIDRLTNRMMYIVWGNAVFFLIVCFVLMHLFRKTKRYSSDRENILLQKFAAIVRRYSRNR